MMTHTEQLTQTLAGRDTVPPNEPDEEEHIIRGEDSLEAIAEKALDSMFDGYVAILYRPYAKVAEVTGLDKYGDPVIKELDQSDILAQQAEDIRLYVTGSMEAGTISVSTQYLEGLSSVSFPAMIDAYITQGVARAEERRARQLEVSNQPAHIEATTDDPDPETTTRFGEIIKTIGATVFGIVNKEDRHPHIRSNPIPVQTKVFETTK